MNINLLRTIFISIAYIGWPTSQANTSSESSGVEILKEKLKELEGIEINDEQRNQRIVFQGDILLSRSEALKIIDDVTKEESESSRDKRQAQRRNTTHENLWVDGVKYAVDSTSSKKMQDGFLVAIKAWEENTCINFTMVDAADALKTKIDFLFATDKDDDGGCLSHVGKLGGYQPLILGPGCETFAHAAHEVGHALGLYHTQCRHDRNRYIKVHWENIERAHRDQYVILSRQLNNNYGLTYDYGSIMHYGSPIDKPAMTPFDANYKTTMGSPMISFMDLSMINKQYGCKERCKRKTSASCKNGGFPHPRGCNKCICPGGYGGPFCDQLPKDCKEGRELEATKAWQPLQAYIYNKDMKGTYATCTYWIKSPTGKIEVEIESIENAHPTIGCAKAGVEIKANADHTLTGYRYCVEPETTIKSNLTLVPIILYTKEFTWTYVTLNYHYVD